MAPLAVSSFFADVASTLALVFFASCVDAPPVVALELAEAEVADVPVAKPLVFPAPVAVAPEFAVELEAEPVENATTAFGAGAPVATVAFAPVPAADGFERALGVAPKLLGAATTAFGFNPQLGVAVEPEDAEEEPPDVEEFAEVAGDAS